MKQQAFTMQVRKGLLTLKVVSVTNTIAIQEMMAALHGKLASHDVRVDLQDSVPNFMMLQFLWALRKWVQEHDKKLTLSIGSAAWDKYLALVGWDH